MSRSNFIAGLVGGVALAGAFLMPSAEAASVDPLNPSIAHKLDTTEVDYVRHTREHRMMEIQRNVDRQRHYGRRGYGPPPHRGYGPPRGYGPRVYGPPRGYGYERGYGPRY